MLMVFTHSKIGPHFTKYLQLVGVPVFFFATGYVFKGDRYRRYSQFFKRRWRGIVVPYISFSLITWFVWLAGMVITNRIQGESRVGVTFVLALSPLLGIPLGIAKFMLYNLALWFLTCLFVADSYFYLLQRRVKSNLGLLFWMLVLSWIGYKLGQVKKLPLPWNADTAATALLYYGLGFMAGRAWASGVLFTPAKYSIARFGKYILRLVLDPGLSFWVKLPVAVALGGGSYLLSQLNSQTHLLANDIGDFVPFHVASIVAVAFWAVVPQLFANSRILHFFGRNSLSLLGLHVLGMGLVGILLLQVFGIHLKDKLPSTPWGLLVGVAAIIFTVPMILLINRYLPWAAGRPPRPRAVKVPAVAAETIRS